MTRHPTAAGSPLLELSCRTPPRDNASRFQAVADMAPMMVWMSGTDRRCDWFNQSWLRFTGRSMAEEIGTGWIGSIHAEDVERCLGIYAVSFDAEAPFEMDYRLRRHDGAYRWVLDQGVPHYSPEGRFMGYVGCCIDIDERRAVEDRLALRTEALRLSERRRDLFLTALVSELSASLASAQQAARSLTEQTPARDVIATAIALSETLQTQLERLLGEARRTARWVAAGSADRQSGTVAALLRQAVEAVPLPMLRHDTRLRLTAPETDRLITTAPPLGRVIGGLLETALRFAEPASALDVTVILDDRQSALSIRIAVTPGRMAPGFLPLALAYFSAPAGDGTEARHEGEGACAREGSSHADLAASAPGVTVFMEPGSRAANFVIGAPWIERSTG